MAWSNGGPLQEKMEDISMASIQKRKKANGEISYRVRIRIEGAPLITETFPTSTQAKTWARRMEAEIRDGRYFGKEDSKEKTFAEFVDRYIEKELPKNQKSYVKQKMIMMWWKSQLGSFYLCRITPSMIAELRDKLLTETTCRKRFRTPSTTNRYLAGLSRAFTIGLKEWHWLKENPVTKISRPKENKHRERYLEKEEIGLLLKECRRSKSPYLYAVTVFALATGARKGEILGIKWEDVDLKRSTVTFRDTKNGETRSVHLSESVLECLKEECTKRIILSEYVFPRGDGKGPACIRTAWEQAVEKAGLKNVCFHSLRHTAASHMAMGGSSVLEISKILGHKSISITSKIYAHLSTASTAGTLNRLDEEILGKYMNG